MDTMFEDTPAYVLDQTFDALIAQTADNPSDTDAFDALQFHITAAQEAGHIDQLVQMSMVLGAMACLGHDHLAPLSNEIGTRLAGHSHHGHEDDDDDEDGD
jgi:hypothetical protein